MGIKTDLSGLHNFAKKVKAWDIYDNQTLLNLILNELVNVGRNYLENLYGTQSIQVEGEIKDNVGIITASGQQVAYLEFGTGTKGEHSYEGNLPTQDITFTSKDREITVQGWTYYYAYRLNMSNKAFVGHIAYAQVWRTAQYLREQAPIIIRQVVERYKNETVY